MPPDRLRTLHEAADRRLGLITRRDLHRCGLSDKQIAHLVRGGVLLRAHRAVYRTPGAATSVEHEALAACLAVGPHAVASHATAGRLWGLVGRQEDRPPEVTVPRAHRSGQKTIVVHRSLRLGPRETTRIGLVPVTRVARTLADLSQRLPTDDLEDALDEALRRKLVTPTQLARYAGLRPLAEDRSGKGVPESRLERIAIALLRRFHLPEPVRQHEVRSRGRTFRIDLAYPDHRVAIELEGRAPHWGRDRWQSDHERRRALEVAGWRVLTFTWWDTTERPLEVALRVAEALGLRPARWTQVR